MKTRTAAYAANLSGVLAVLSGAFAILFFWLEAPYLSDGAGQQPLVWGPLSDICPIVQMLALLIVAQALDQLSRSDALRLQRLTTLIGSAGMLGVSVLQLLLVIGVMPFEQEIGPMLIATAMVGVWLILVNYQGRRQAQLSGRAAGLGVGVGLALMLQPLIFSALGGTSDWQTSLSNPLLMVGAVLVFGLSYAGFPLWLFRLGRTFTANQREFNRQPDAAIARAP